MQLYYPLFSANIGHLSICNFFGYILVYYANHDKLIITKKFFSTSHYLQTSVIFEDWISFSGGALFFAHFFHLNLFNRKIYFPV